MREDHGEIEVALDAFKPIEISKLKIANPFDLIELADIKGDLHMHTTASDGSNSIEELVAEAKRRGYSTSRSPITPSRSSRRTA